MNIMEKIRGLEQGGKGYLNPKLVRACTFYTISTCIGLSTITAILAIWEFTAQDTLWRTISTFGVITLGAAIFAVVNTWFGSEWLGE